MSQDDVSSEETLLATRNALKLGGSLLVTWGVAIAMRLVLPRYLGPDNFGALSSADAFATTIFVALGLGVNVYVRKEVSVRPSHASDFIGGAFLLRIALSLAILAAMALVMQRSGQPAALRELVYLFAIAQFFVHTNATLSALLHAKGSVDGMSVLAVVTKLFWAGGAVLAIATGAGLWGFALAFLLPEAIESVVLFVLAGRDVGLVFRVDTASTRAMLMFSLPYYLNDFATTAYGKLDVALLGLLGGSREAGFYAAASAIAGLTLLATPLIGWVLMPTLARAAARSHDELFHRIQHSTSLILGVAIPASLLICLGADLLIGVVFGAAFAPATLALRILAATFVVTYVAIVYAASLLMVERAWALTAISIVGLVVNVTLNLALVPTSMRFFGEGGGGAGSALAMLGTEIAVTTAMIAIVGRRAIHRDTLRMVGKCLVACVLTVIVDRLAAPLGWARLALDAAVYSITAIATGAVNTREVVAVARAALRGKAALSASLESSGATDGDSSSI